MSPPPLRDVLISLLRDEKLAARIQTKDVVEFL
jgi:hypothetical protein